MKKLLVIFLILTNQALRAEKFEVAGAEITWSVPYTFGEHEGIAKGLEGHLDAEMNGKLTLPTTGLKTDNEEMQCHMWESLGLDYKQSDFPDEHVCEDDKLPSKGKNAIVHKEITFDILSSKVVERAADSITLELNGKWSIHGKSLKKTYRLEFIRQKDDLWRTTKEDKFNLSDFGIVVKKFLFISVEGEVSVDMNIDWRMK